MSTLTGRKGRKCGKIFMREGPGAWCSTSLAHSTPKSNATAAQESPMTRRSVPVGCNESSARVQGPAGSPQLTRHIPVGAAAQAPPPP